MTADKHAVLTGPIRGSVTLSDGTEVDVRPLIVYLDTYEQALETSQKVSEVYASKGHPDHDFGDKFFYDKEQTEKNFALAKGTTEENN